MESTRKALLRNRDWLRMLAAHPDCDALCRANYLMRARVLDMMVKGSINIQKLVRRMSRGAKQGGR